MGVTSFFNKLGMLGIRIAHLLVEIELLSTKMQATIAKNCFTITRSQHLAQPAAQSLDQRTIPETNLYLLCHFLRHIIT